MVSTILQLVGVGAIVAGVCLFSVPAGIIVGGIGLILIGLAVAR